MTILPLPPDLAADLERVEQLVLERTRTRSAIVSVAERHLIGVPRPRAATALLCAALGEYSAERTLHAAAAIELIFGATRVHDDLVDEAERRLGQVTHTPRWGGNVTLMVGDYLLALAAAEMALTPDPRIIAIYSRCVMAICEAELAPLPAAPDAPGAVDLHLARIGGKSASLFEAAAQAGGVCGALPPPQLEALARFGYHAGMADAIAAEARDLAGDPDSPATGAALRAGAATLPLLYAAEGGDLHAVAALHERRPSPAQAAAAIRAAHASGSVARAAEAARRHAAEAAAHLASLPDGPNRDALAALATALATP